MAEQKNKIEKRNPPEDWSQLLHYPPYYVSNPNPETLQIWVKPRYFFAYLVAILATLSVALFVLTIVFSGNRYSDLVAFLAGVLKVFRLFFFLLDIPVETVPWSQLMMVSAVIPLVIIVLTLMFFLIYKRQGLIEVTKEGVLLVDNPRISPGQGIFIPAAEIADFKDTKLYSRGSETGTALFAIRANGNGTEILRVYAAPDDYNALCVEIYRALGRLKKDLKGIAEKLPGNKKNHKEAVDALFSAVDRHREESIAAHAEGQKKREKWFRARYLLPGFFISLVFQVWYHLFTSQSGFIWIVAVVLGFAHVAVLYAFASFLFDRIGRWKAAQKLGAIMVIVAGLLTWNLRYPAVENMLIAKIWDSAKIVSASLVSATPPANGGPSVRYEFELSGKKHLVTESVPWEIFQKRAKKLKPGYRLQVQVNAFFPSYRRIVWP